MAFGGDNVRLFGNAASDIFADFGSLEKAAGDKVVGRTAIGASLFSVN
jgi:hypothetical protein